MSFELKTPRNRTCDFSGEVFRADGTTGIELAGTDKIRAKIYRDDADTPLIEVVSGTPTANGSSMTITQLAAPAAYTLRIAQGDTATLMPGTYMVDIFLVDDSETAPADAAKPIEDGVLHITPAGGGPIN